MNNMKILILFLTLPTLLFSQYLADRFIFEVYGNYREVRLEGVNNLLDEHKGRTLVQDWFDGSIVDLKDGIGLGAGIGYGFNHYFSLNLRYDSIKYKSYNRSTTNGIHPDNSRPIEVEANLNYKITAKALSLNLLMYPINSPLFGLYLGIGGGGIFNTKYFEKYYFVATFQDDGSKELWANTTFEFKQNDLSPMWQAYIGVDIALGILTSLVFEAGYRYAKVAELKHDNSQLDDQSSRAVAIELEGYNASLFLKFLF
jgi:hypothetical protein